jgi:ketopantoate hydroxymethyltransferase
MKLLIFESNLFWSTRLVHSARALGHEALVVSEPQEGDAAIVNLGAPNVQMLIEELKRRGIYVIGHAGHKEKDLHALGREAGCDKLATNSELTFKLGSLLDQAA